MSIERFYIATQGNDDAAYREAMQFACGLANKDPEIKKVILLAVTQRTTGWLDRIFGDKIVKQLFTGRTFENCKPVFKIETIKTYKDCSTPSEIVITLGLDEEHLFKVDDYYSVKAIIAIPWLMENIQKWVQTWNPKELRGKKDDIKPFPNPTCIVIKALEELTETINLSSGFSHPSDENRVKTTILTLHKYEAELNSDIVASYLIRELGWESDLANKIMQLINTLNTGKSFRGGDRKGLQHNYKRWKEQCK